jgi:hypothetical protein
MTAAAQHNRLTALTLVLAAGLVLATLIAINSGGAGPVATAVDPSPACRSCDARHQHLPRLAAPKPAGDRP